MTSPLTPQNGKLPLRQFVSLSFATPKAVAYLHIRSLTTTRQP